MEYMLRLGVLLMLLVLLLPPCQQYKASLRAPVLLF